MTPKKLLVLTAVVAILFAFIVLFERKMPSTADRARKGELYWDLPEDRVTSVTLVRGPETVELHKNGTSWRLVKPDAYPADTFAVDGVVNDLADMKRSGGAENVDAKPADYGLEPPAAKATFAWTEADDPEKKTRTVEFGHEVPGTDMVAARLEGSTHVMFVPSSVLTGVRKPVDDFRSRDLLGGLSADASRIEILRGRGRLILTKKDGIWWMTEPIADLASPSEADRLVAQLTGARAKDFVHGNDDLAAMGLNPPLYRVTITAGKEPPASVDFGATRADGNSIYARREGQIMTVDGEIVEELSKEAEAYRSTSAVAFNRGDVNAVEASFPDATFAVTRKDGGWTTSQGKPVLAGAADDLLSAILDLKGKSFLEEVEAKSFAAPVATVTVRMKAGAPWTITLHPRTGVLAGRVSSRPGALLLDKDAASTIEAAFKKAIAEPTPVPTKKAK